MGGDGGTSTSMQYLQCREVLEGYTLGPAKFFWATRLTQDSLKYLDQIMKIWIFIEVSISSKIAEIIPFSVGRAQEHLSWSIGFDPHSGHLSLHFFKWDHFLGIPTGNAEQNADSVSKDSFLLLQLKNFPIPLIQIRWHCWRCLKEENG